MNSSKRPQARKRWITLAVVGVLALIIGVRVAGHRGRGQATVELPIAVRVAHPQVAPVYDWVAVSGTVAAQEQAYAYSKVPGKLQRYAKVEGDWVAKDEPIAWIERDEIGMTFEPSPVKAPIAGQIAQRGLEIGAAVTPGGGMGGTPVAVVINPNRLEVEVNVPENDAFKVRERQEARLRLSAFPGEVFRGTVSRVSPVIDPQSRTAGVVIDLASSSRLKAGMFAEVEIVVASKPKSLLLPQEALLKQNQQFYVYVIEGDRVRRRDVATGWAQGGAMEIASGLAPEDRVVVEGQTRLTEQSKIQVAEGE